MIHINGETKVYGILGNPVNHSLSPLMHNAAFAFCKINAVYVPFSVKKPDSSIKHALLQLNLGGLSITIPHKTWAAQIADQKDILTQYCGAANTLVPKGKKWYAFNTDGAGALQALREELRTLRGKSFLLIGYGGSAMAVAHALLLEEKPRLLVITGRNRKKRESFVSYLQEKHPRYASCIYASDYKSLHSEDVDVIIHTTPLGMQGKPQDLPLPENFLQKPHCVFDIVYTPMRTPLLRHAAHKGCRTIPGYLMLLHQAWLQFEIFTGKKAPRGIMERELLRTLKAQR